MNEVSNEQINAWKRDHGKVYVAKTEGLVGYFRKPTRKELSYAMTLREKPLEMTELVLRSCWLGGDEGMLEDNDCLLGCDKLVERLLHVKELEVGEL